MTVASSVSRVSYAGNGSTQNFAVPYYFLENSHLRVVLRSSAGVETVQTITTNYTVTGAGNPAGGQVSMVVAPPAGSTLVIVRNVPVTQETDYQANDPFPAESHERALDKLTMIAQQSSDIETRSIKIPETETTNTVLPASGTRANKLLGFSNGGDVALSNTTIAQLDTAINAFVNNTANNASGILYDPAGTGAQQTNVQAKLREAVSVKDFGAVGDGIADDTTAIQNAFAVSGNVFIPSGMTCLINKMVIATNDLHIEIAKDSSLVLSNSVFTGSGIEFSGTNVSIRGGTITAETGGYFAAYLVYATGDNFLIEDCSVGYPVKPVYVAPDGTNIPYGVASLRCNGAFSQVRRCELYNCPGSGLQIAGNKSAVFDSHIHDSVLGIMIRDCDDILVQGNQIIDNNAGGKLSGADGILSFAYAGTIGSPTGSRGISIMNNIIAGSGEHGTYLQCDDIVISGNIVYGNLASGIKANARNIIISNNNCYDNLFGDTDNAEIYLQSRYGNSIISNNRCTNSDPLARNGMRVAAWIESRDQPDESENMLVTGNFVGSYANYSGSFYSKVAQLVTNNIFLGNILLARSSSATPNATLCMISQNYVDGSGSFVVGGIIESNIFTGSVNQISALEFNNNIVQNQVDRIFMQCRKIMNNQITYDTVTTSLFEQAGSAASNSDFVFTKNRFIANVNIPVLLYSSLAVSGARNIFEGNQITGAALFNGWGDNHLFIGNIRIDGGSLATIRGDNCIATNNIGSFTDVGSSNIVSDNK
jgi:hypothetical protein